MLCYGLLQLDRETAAFVAGDRVCSAGSTRTTPGSSPPSATWCTSARDNSCCPAASRQRRAWAEMIGEPLTNTSRRSSRCSTPTTAGSLYFAKTLEDLDETHLAAVFAQGEDDEDRARSDTQRLPRLHRRGDRAGGSVDFPFVRLGADPALLLGSLRTTADGQLRHTRDFWEVALGDRSLPDDARRTLGRARRRRPRRGGLAAAAADRRASPHAPRARAHLSVRRAPDRSAARRLGGRPGVADPRVSPLSCAAPDARASRRRATPRC